MGSDFHYRDERPAHPVTVDGFWMDSEPVTNASFSAFVQSTGYITLAEQAPDPAEYPGARPENCQPASMVFTKTSGPVDLWDSNAWWRYMFGANWRHPAGPDSSIEGMEKHPVVHVAYCDAEAYANWAGKRIPTEAEWELAARGGIEGADYAWGNDLAPNGEMLANYWQGNFPYENLNLDGWELTSPVGSYLPNGFGLYDMIGNVWEWTTDWYADRHSIGVRSCCTQRNPLGGKESESYHPNHEARIPRKVLKGGSHLCAENYCRRYRPAARHAHPVDTSTSHIGFRCIIRTD